MMVEKFFFRKFNKCCAFLMLLLFASGTLWAGHSPEKITMKVTNEKLVKVLEEIKKQSGYNFVYNEKFVKDLGGITVDVKEVSLDSVMKEVLEVALSNSRPDYFIGEGSTRIIRTEV